MDIEFVEFDVVKLDEVLGHVYMESRKTDGKQYKTTSLNCLRYSLNRYLKGQPHYQKFDIIKDSSFSNSNENLKAAIAELKRMWNITRQ
jgi:hypothetical protein